MCRRYRLGRVAQRRLLLEIVDPGFQLVAVGGKLVEPFLPLIDLSQQLVLSRLLIGEIGLGLAEPRRQGGSLRLGLVQRRGELRDLVALGRCGLIGRTERVLVVLKLRPHLLGQRDDLALRRREIAARGRHLVTQTGQLILEIDVGRLDAACRQLCLSGVVGVMNVANTGDNHGSRGDPRRRQGYRV